MYILNVHNFFFPFTLLLYTKFEFSGLSDVHLVNKFNCNMVWLVQRSFSWVWYLRVIHWFQYTLLSPVLCFTFKYLMLEIGDARNFLWLHALTYVYFFPVVMLGDLFEPLILLCQCSDLVCCVSVQVFFYETCRFL